MNDGDVGIYVLDATVTVNIKSAVGGTTDPPPGTYKVKRGMSISWQCDTSEPGNPCRIKLTVKAIPAEGYTFKYWVVGGQVVYDNPLTLDPPCQNMTLDVTPVFESTTPTPTPTPSPTPTTGIDVSSQLILIGLALLVLALLMKKRKQRF
jgi:LPXTG-motif cell wall-anchored protein